MQVLRSLEVEGNDYQCVVDEFVSIAKLFEFPDVKAYLNVSCYSTSNTPAQPTLYAHNVVSMSIQRPHR